MTQIEVVEFIYFTHNFDAVPKSLQYFGRTFVIMELKLEIRPDKMVATIFNLPTSRIEATTIIQEINSVLKTNKITHGIQKDNMMNTIARALKKKVDIDKLIIAIGKTPVNGTESRLKFNFNVELDDPPEDLVSKNQPIINEYTPNFFWSNQVIAEELAPEEGEDGYNIFGEELMASPGEIKTFNHDQNITKSENKFISNVAGIATYVQAQLKITPPLYISADNLEARFIVFPPHETAGTPASSDLKELISQANIHQGLDEKVVDGIMSGPANETGPEVVILARGKAPVNGEDNKITFHFDEDLFDPGPLIKEGNESITAYTSNFFKVNQVIATETKATNGEDGCDLFGEILKALPGNPTFFEHDDSITKTENNYIAKFAGIACNTENGMTVTPTIHISEDKMTVHMVVLPITEPSRIPDVSDIGSMLSWCKICKGLDKEALASILKNISTSPELKRAVIAKGKNPEKGSDAGIDWKVNPEVTDLESLLSPLTQDNFTKIKDNVVMINQPIAVETASSPGTAGWDVYGNELPPAEVREVQITPGNNVEKSENNFIASTYGICEVKKSTINVTPLISVSKDKMEAELTVISVGGELLPKSLDEIASNLTEIGIVEGISLANAKRAYRDGIGENQMVKMVVAKGTPPIVGHKEKILSRIDFSMKAGKESNDGNIDFRERGFVNNVHPKDVVAVQIDAKAPVDGKDVFGQTVEAGWEEEEGITIGQNIKKSGENLYIATIKGVVCLIGNNLEVMEILEIKSDIDYSVGNLKIDGAVIIHGSVLPGFSINARGEVIIKEGVENAKVHSLKNITVAQGIVGDKASVVSEADITVGFINTGTVQAKGNIVIGDTIYNGHIRCDGKLEATMKHGMITGGEVYASEGIKCKAIGNEAGTPTKIGILMDSSKYDALTAVKEKLQTVIDAISAINNKLGETALSDPKKAFEIAPPSKRDEMFKLFSNLSDLLKVRKTLEEQEESLIESGNARRKSAKVQAHNCFPGTTIVFNEKKLKIDESMKMVSFRRDYIEDKIVNG